VVVRVERAPIHPADLILLLAGTDPARAEFGTVDGLPRVSARLSSDAARAQAGRIGRALPVGLEGAGVVVAAGAQAQALLGQRVAVLAVGGGLYGEFVTVPAADCAPLPAGLSARDGAGLFCNPLTALAMVETLHQTGRHALVHTAAASSLGQMLVKICREDGIGLVNVVRREEQALLLKRLGAERVCNSTTSGFADDLHRALVATGATIAFDAIGGGTLAGELAAAMERAAAGRLGEFSPFGSAVHKQVCIYGGLDSSPTILSRRGYGMVWDIGGWAMPPVLERAGPARKTQLVQRVLAGLTTTFASHYAAEITLAQALERDHMLEYCRLSTGGKFLIAPN
jgi:NADPH2:quinone reductase